MNDALARKPVASCAHLTKFCIQADRSGMLTPDFQQFADTEDAQHALGLNMKSMKHREAGDTASE
jgi:hypothetical protein